MINTVIIKDCPICSKKFSTYLSRIKDGRGKFCSRKCSDIGRSRVQIEKKNPCWRGGRILLKGYWFIYNPSHPHAWNKKYVAEHRLVMEEKLGRYLKQGEVVHHINHIRTDNRPENLELVTKSQHSAHHSGKENNPMYGIIRDSGLGKMKVKMPKKIIELYEDGDFITIPFSIIQKYLNNIRDIPVNGQPWGRTSIPDHADPNLMDWDGGSDYSEWKKYELRCQMWIETCATKRCHRKPRKPNVSIYER